jgi:hypothetical protein
MSLVVSDPNKFHRVFLGEEPNEKQRLLYSSFPAMRGFSFQEKDPALFEATLVLAIVQTFPAKQGEELVKSYLFVPASMSAWSGEQVGASATKMFGVLKKKKSVAGAKMLALLIQSVVSGSRVLQLRNVPDRWAAFGFDQAGPVPEWMRTALLAVP